jgi:hypothetical protein
LAFTNRAFKVAQHYANVANDKEVPPLHENMLPIIRRFHSRATDYEIGDEYYSIRDKVQGAKNVEKAYDEGELSEEDYSKWSARNGWILDLEDTFDYVEEELTYIRQNRTESTYRADAQRRMELQREAVEEFYDLWANQNREKKVGRYSREVNPEAEGQRHYDETAVRAATDQMAMLGQMIQARDIGSMDKKAADKYLEIHGWKLPVMDAYRAWFKMSMNPPEGMSDRAKEIITKRFMDAYYDAEQAHMQKTPAEAGVE